MSRLTPDILEQISNHVQGTCHSLEQQATDVLEDIGLTYDDLTFEEEMQVIDYVEERHFLCVVCGWWCEAGDTHIGNNDEMICSGCGEDAEEEE